VFCLRSRLRRAASGWGCGSRRLLATPRTWPHRLWSRSAVFPLPAPTTASSISADDKLVPLGRAISTGRQARSPGRPGRGGKAEGGHLRIYRNLDGKAEPRLAEPIWFHDQVPTGLTPLG